MNLCAYLLEVCQEKQSAKECDVRREELKKEANIYFQKLQFCLIDAFRG